MDTARMQVATPETVRTHEWGTQPEMFGPRHEYRLALIARETSKLPRSSRILDAAIGLGQLAARLRLQGHRVIGIDASFEAARSVNVMRRIPVVVGDLTRMPFRTSVFDGATSGETLEHLDDDAAAVSEIARVLRDKGTCIVTVPAMKMLWSDSDTYYEHRRRYSRAGLRKLFSSEAFRIDRSTFWGFPVVLLYDTLFLLPMNRRRARKDVAGDGALKSIARVGRSRWLVNLVKAFFSIDRLFFFLPFGPGLLLVAEKRDGGKRTGDGA